MLVPFSIRRAACVALVIAAALPARSAEGLTLEQAQRIAQGRSQQLVAQSALASAAREQSVAAGQLPDPVLTLGVNNLPINTADRFSLTRDFMTMRSLGVMQEITRADKRKSRSARFERAAEVAQAQRVAALVNLRRDTALAWLERYYQERLRELLQAQHAEASLQVDAADAAYRGGRGTLAEVYAARSAVARIDDRLRHTERQIATATTRLVRWVGDDATQPLGAPPDLGVLRLDAAGLEDQVAHHPRIAVLARQEAVARAEVDLALSNKRADWSLELMLSQRGPAYSNMVSVNLSIPLQFDQKNRQDRELAARLALAAQAAAERAEATREHLAEARAWLQEWRGNRDRLARYDSVLIPLAAERTRAALASYRGGSGALPGLLEARRMEIDTRIDRLLLEMETAGLWARLNYLIASEHEVGTQDGPIIASENDARTADGPTAALEK